MPKKKADPNAPAETAAVEEASPEVEESTAEETAVEETVEASAEEVASEEVAEVAAEETPAEEAVEASLAESDEPAIEEASKPTANDAPDVDMGGYDYSEVTEEDVKLFLKTFPTKEAFDAYVAEYPNGPEKARLEHIGAMIQKIAEASAENSGPIIKSGARKVAVRGFFGAFKNSIFLEDAAFQFGVAEDVDDETFEALKSEYPNAEIIVS